MNLNKIPKCRRSLVGFVVAALSVSAAKCFANEPSPENPLSLMRDAMAYGQGDAEEHAPQPQMKEPSEPEAFPGSESFKYTSLPHWTASPAFLQGNEWTLFDHGETHLELGWARFGDQDGERDTDGITAAVVHYFSRYVGVGAEYFFTNGQAHEHALNGAFRLRVPFDEAAFAVTFALGGGGLFGGSEGSAGSLLLGAGLEFRLLEHLSLVSNVRYLEASGEADLYCFMVGMSVVF